MKTLESLGEPPPPLGVEAALNEVEWSHRLQQESFDEPETIDVALEVLLQPLEAGVHHRPYVAVWSQLLGSDPVIPYDVGQREEKFAGALETLSVKVAKWLADDRADWRNAILRRVDGLEAEAEEDDLP